MTRLTIPVFSAVVLLGAACGGGGSSDDYRSEISCQDLCAKNLECDPETDVAACTSSCEASKDVIRGLVLDAMASCVLDHPCNSPQLDACVERAMALAPSSYAESFIRSMCSKIMECAGGGTVDYCVNELEKQAGDSLAYFGIFKTSVLACLSDCYHGLSCDEIENDEDALDRCQRECGITDMDIY